jgi:hypothetical protein
MGRTPKQRILQISCSAGFGENASRVFHHDEILQDYFTDAAKDSTAFLSRLC